MWRQFVCVGSMALLAASCTSDEASFDPAGGTDELGELITEGKQDGIFNSQDIALGESHEGSVAGESIVLYVLNLQANDQINMTATATGGGLQPAAYLYLGTDQFISPANYDVGTGNVTLNYRIPQDGEYYIVVKAYHGGSGSYRLELSCTAGPCNGAPPVQDHPLAVQDNCLQSTFDCAFDQLPSHESLESAAAMGIVTSCLTNASEYLALDCSGACTGQGQDVCNSIARELVAYAGASTACHRQINDCMADCAEFFNDSYEYIEFEQTIMHACWVGGHSGNCSLFVEGHEDCGGTEFTDAGADTCYARCSYTEGAHYEGPWDGCQDECWDVCSATAQECQLECETSENPGHECELACLERYDSTECEDWLD